MSTDPDATPSDDDATRQDDATSDDDGSAPPTLCVRLHNDGIPKTERDPRLERLDWMDRWKLHFFACDALAIKPAEHLHAISHFMPQFAADDPTMREQWFRMARIFRAAFYEAQDLDSQFLKQADSLARAVLKQRDDFSLFSARFAAFERLREEVVSMLQMNFKTAHIATQLYCIVSQPEYHEIACHIPDLDRPVVDKMKMLRAMNTARQKPAEDNFKEQAECMIRAWLRAMGCPRNVEKHAFDAERARDEREIGTRTK